MIINNYTANSADYKNRILIIIRGTASSGKSTISHILGNLITMPFMIFHCEDTLFFDMIPSDYLVNGKRSKEGYYLERNEEGDITNVSASNWAAEMYQLHTSALHIYTQAGMNIICDSNLSDKNSLKNLLQYVPHNYSIYIFSLVVPLSILEEREQLRANNNERTIGFAKHQKTASDEFGYIDNLTIHVGEKTTPLETSHKIFNFLQHNNGITKADILEKLK